RKERSGSSSNRWCLPAMDKREGCTGRTGRICLPNHQREAMVPPRLLRGGLAARGRTLVVPSRRTPVAKMKTAPAATTTPPQLALPPPRRRRHYPRTGRTMGRRHTEPRPPA
ncbi:unnamed protein product, partial [Ectocarpus fasciculatus]